MGLLAEGGTGLGIFYQLRDSPDLDNSGGALAGFKCKGGTIRVPGGDKN